MERKRSRTAKAILREKQNKTKLEIKPIQPHKNRYIDQWERIEGPHTYGPLIYDKGGKNIQCRKDSPSNR